MDGAVFLAGRARHDGYAGGEQIVAHHVQAGFAAAEQGGEEGLHFLIDGIAGGLEALFGFAVDLGDGFFQQRDGGLQVGALVLVVAVALAGFGQFVERGQVHRAEGLDAAGNAVDLLRPVGFQVACLLLGFERGDIGLAPQ